ncbi:MAG: signal recognition particle subunit SRP19/SEC65 family protein [Conexivisphaerales archaeon]
MKEEDKQVIWLDYFDSSLSRAQGRRVPKSLSISNPRPEPFMDVLKKMNIEAQNFEARHPKRNNRRTFYIQAKRTIPKQQLLRKLAQGVKGIK